MHLGGCIEARALPESERLVERSLLVARREDSRIARHPALPGRPSADATGQAAGVSSIPLCMRRRVTDSKPSNKSSRASRTDPLKGLLSRHYATLRTIAERTIAQHRLMQKAAGPDRISPSSLVAEAALRLLLQRTDLKNPEHLEGLAAISMQRAIKDRARKRGTRQRAVSGRPRKDAAQSDTTPDVLHELEALRAMHPRQADIVSLVGVKGLSVEEAAKELGISKPTAERDLRTAREWLARRLRGA